ncbi:MAG: hypothetical protein AAGI24_17025 [Pseudomonadota bacterium]
MDQILFLIGSVVFGILGVLHLVFTIFTNKFDAYDSSVTEAMKESSIVLSKDVNLWKAWIGFNVSHSLGAILLAAVYVPLAFDHLSLLRNSLWFSTLPLLFSVSYLVLAKKYWFKLPLVGILIASACFLGAALLVNT